MADEAKILLDISIQYPIYSFILIKPSIYPLAVITTWIAFFFSSFIILLLVRIIYTPPMGEGLRKI